MATLASVMAELEAKGSEKMRRVYHRHGMPSERSFGVSNADLKIIAKTIKKQQALALELYATGNVDAMYLAGIVADGKPMTRTQLNDWAHAAASMSMISEYSVAWVAVENPAGRELALEWISSPLEHVACSGWCTLSGRVTTLPDADLDMDEIRGLLARVEREIHGAQNRVKLTMNNFVIAVASYVMPLAAEAEAAARRIGPISVDMGDTACEVRVASNYIEKVKAAGKQGQKRKTIRC